LEIYRGSRIDPNTIGTYEVNYIIAPRINAMGRIEHGIDSLRMLCTTSRQNAVELANKLGRVNQLRQKIVEEVLVTARKSFTVEKKQKIIIISDASYHEGVIGLAAGKLVEEFYLPAIVISRGEKISKASARSISGFNIIEAIRHFDGMLEAGGGHPMAAGFSILTERIEDFTQKMLLYSAEMVSDDMLSKKLKIDMELEFDQLTPKLYETLKEGEPFGIGNPQPVFMTQDVEVVDSRIIGKEKNHLKLKLKDKGVSFWAVGFGMAEAFSGLGPEKKIDVAYNLEENAWNGSVSLELKLKDLRLGR
jgi:single-stranded-DNA-specific exonuclease